MSSTSSEFDPFEATIHAVREAILFNKVTCRLIVQAYLARISAINPIINAVICLNPKVLEEADALDDALSKGCKPGALTGVPILIKDNFNTINMKTTGGCRALKDLQASEDAKVVKALKEAGALILGKANMHEMALEGLSVSSLGGQTLNPYDLTRTPGGSSGGSGAAAAASLCVVATGTDTVNSLRSPASANSLFSCRPTYGLISRDGVIPVSHTQDTVGPIARCVKDVATVLTVMAGIGPDKSDSATERIDRPTSITDYAAKVTQGRLDGLRIGMLEAALSTSPTPEELPVQQAYERMVCSLTDAGTTMVRVSSREYFAPTLLATLDTQRHEYREALDAYLRRLDIHGPRPENFAELYTDDFLVIPAQYEYVTTAGTASTLDEEYKNRKAGITKLGESLYNTFERLNLDVIIYPQQKCLTVKVGSPSQHLRQGILAALTGFPSVCVPMGFSAPSEDAPIGVPTGMEILGRPWSEEKLLQIAYQIEQSTNVRRPPRIAEIIGRDARFKDKIPKILPDTSRISYPQGTLQ